VYKSRQVLLELESEVEMRYDYVGAEPIICPQWPALEGVVVVSRWE
jgi:hypothetical protein